MIDEPKNLICYRGHNYPIWDVKFSTNSTYFVSSSNDKTGKLWQVEYLFPIQIFAGFQSDVSVNLIKLKKVYNISS